jgi:hypothetical protein
MSSSSSSSDRDLTAFELIKQFRQSKPMSREERQRARESKGVSSKMWWEEDKGEKPSLSLSKEKKSPKRKQPPSLLADDDLPPEPRILHNKPQKQSSHHLGSSLRSSGGIASNVSFDNDFDSVLDKQIFALKRELYEKEKDVNLKSYLHSPYTSRDFSSLSPSRDRGRGERAGSGIALYREGGRSVLSPHHSVSLSPGRRSFEERPIGGFGEGLSLKNTGLLGLLNSDLKLDGEKGSSSEDKNINVDAVQSSLDELLKSLNIPKLTNGFNPDDLTIPEITNKLNTEFMELIGSYQIKEKEETELKKNEEKLKQQGREEERKKLLFDDIEGKTMQTNGKQDLSENFLKDFIPTIPMIPPEPQLSQQQGFLEEKYSEPFATNLVSLPRERQADFNLPAAASSTEHVNPASATFHANAARDGVKSVHTESVRILQKAMDNELNAMDEMFLQARNLRLNFNQVIGRCDPRRLQPNNRSTYGSASSRHPPNQLPFSPHWQYSVHPAYLDEYHSSRKNDYYDELSHEGQNLLKASQAININLNSAITTLISQLPESKDLSEAKVQLSRTVAALNNEQEVHRRNIETFVSKSETKEFPLSESMLQGLL